MSLQAFRLSGPGTSFPWSAGTARAAHAIAGEPFFCLTVAILFFKSLSALAIIDNAEPSVLDFSALVEFVWSPIIFLSFVALTACLGFLVRGRARLAFYILLNV